MANSGYKGWTNLEQYYTDDNTTTGTTKANTEGQADYIAPVIDNVSCNPYFIELDSYGVNIDFLNQDVFFMISSNYPSYTFSSNAAWLTAFGGSGMSQTVRVHATKNNGVERYGQIAIVYNSVTLLSFDVTQLEQPY